MVEAPSWVPPATLDTIYTIQVFTRPFQNWLLGPGGKSQVCRTKTREKPGARRMAQHCWAGKNLVGLVCPTLQDLQNVQASIF